VRFGGRVAIDRRPLRRTTPSSGASDDDQPRSRIIIRRSQRDRGEARPVEPAS